jgi:hypothetical protein
MSVATTTIAIARKRKIPRNARIHNQRASLKKRASVVTTAIIAATKGLQSNIAARSGKAAGSSAQRLSAIPIRGLGAGGRDHR